MAPSRRENVLIAGEHLATSDQKYQKLFLRFLLVVLTQSIPVISLSRSDIG